MISRNINNLKIRNARRTSDLSYGNHWTCICSMSLLLTFFGQCDQRDSRTDVSLEFSENFQNMFFAERSIIIFQNTGFLGTVFCHIGIEPPIPSLHGKIRVRKISYCKICSKQYTTNSEDFRPRFNNYRCANRNFLKGKKVKG